MSYFFLKREKDKFILKLHKDLYKKEVILKAFQSEGVDFSWNLGSSKDYHLVRIATKNPEDCLDLLNYLIYLGRIA